MEYSPHAGQGVKFGQVRWGQIRKGLTLRNDPKCHGELLGGLMRWVDVDLTCILESLVGQWSGDGLKGTIKAGRSS